MTVLSDEKRISARRSLAEMPEPVSLLAFTDDGCSACAATRELLREVARVAPRVRLELHDPSKDALLAARYGIDKVPAVALLTGGVRIADTRIRFFGGLGREDAAALVEDVAAVSRASLACEVLPLLAPATRARLAALRRPVHIRVFTHEGDPGAARTVALAHRFALASPLVRADAIDADDFPELARRYHAERQLRTIVNETVMLTGAVDEAYLLRAVEEAATEELGPWQGGAVATLARIEA